MIAQRTFWREPFSATLNSSSPGSLHYGESTDGERALDRRQRQNLRHKLVTNEKRQALQPAASFMKTGEPWRARTSDPLIKSAVKRTPAGYGSYDLLTFVTGCSRQRVYMLPAINAYFSVFWSQVGHNGIVQQFLDRA